MIIDTRDGITLHVVYRPWPRWGCRRWHWTLIAEGEQLLDGQAWTRAGAVAHGRIARWLRISVDLAEET
jgi:hypothetical protein